MQCVAIANSQLLAGNKSNVASYSYLALNTITLATSLNTGGEPELANSILTA